MKIIGAVIAALIVALIVVLAALSATPALTMNPPVKAIGAATPVNIDVSSTYGLRRFTALLEQNGARYTIFDQHHPAHRLLFLRRREAPHAISFPAGKQQASALRAGKATLIVEAQSNDFLGRTTTASSEVDVVLEPPRLVVDEEQHYINQGGSELVTFTVSGDWSDAGVKLGPNTFRSFPLPGRPKNERFSLFAFSWDLPVNTVPHVYARNAAGTEVTGRFWYKVFPKPFRTRDLEITDAFLDKVVNQIDPGGTGDLLTRFLHINRELRKQNNQQLSDLRLKTEERVLWNGPFLQLANSQVEAHFADVRSYIYKGKKVDQQVHLGFDLAVTAHVPVLAANDGHVVWASDLGIYGNCIVLDHGYGLQSIYGHLSRIDVKVGDMLKKGQAMGHSGSTGLAGGDHLHFSMQVDGVQVNPVEWFDAHWIHDRILSKLAPAGQAAAVQSNHASH
ncbi:MAG TPA: M23 family metallopeptidase [Bryobacteraceae bacterium]|nr:M23 family metallopeptidase [Bryobacteraceae bacterium]